MHQPSPVVAGIPTPAALKYRRKYASKPTTSPPRPHVVLGATVGDGHAADVVAVGGVDLLQADTTDLVPVAEGNGDHSLLVLAIANRPSARYPFADDARP